MGNRWTPNEDELLRTLRKANVPYRDKVKHFPERTQDSLRNRMNSLRMLDKVADMDFETIGVLDIETTDFKADIGFMLSWAMHYPNENKTTWDVLKRRDFTTGRTDKRICKSLNKELSEIDLLITYFGTRFDIPFARTRAMMQGVAFPLYGSMRHIDAYYFARSKVATHRKSLKAISVALGLAGKTDVDIAVWAKAKIGHMKSLDLVLEHNIADVEVTWNVYKKLLKYGRFHAKSI